MGQFLSVENSPRGHPRTMPNDPTSISFLGKGQAVVPDAQNHPNLSRSFLDIFGSSDSTGKHGQSLWVAVANHPSSCSPLDSASLDCNPQSQ